MGIFKRTTEPEGAVLTDEQVTAICAPHYGHRVGISRRQDAPDRIVSIDCLTEGDGVRDLRIWPPTP